MMRRSPVLITGLVLGIALGLLDLAGLAGLFVEPAPPPALVIVSALLGVVTLVAVPAAWRGGRRAAAVVTGARIASALLAVPAFFAPEAPGWAKTAAAAAIAVTVVAVALIWAGSRRRVGAGVTTRTASLLCVAGAILGIAGGLAMIVVAPEVGQDRFSYPFDTPMHVITQLVFAVNHVLLLVAVLAVGRAAIGPSRAGRAGVLLAAAGMIGLTLCELGAMALAGAQVDDSRVDLLNLGYGVSSLAIGAGLVLAGIPVIRSGRWRGWARYTVLACGLALFAVVLPAISGPMVAGRLALIAWMVLWAAMGVALARDPGAARPAVTPAAAMGR
ncbi:hypothetical protein IL992_36780 [Microbispora sp. NEAU-D428]|uniref:hypothetical protein n=1 Tax=Microbispora sitophila TaxID=2771537 RepID=UPI001865DA4B|nr:hypothetical protein [Microbispora sitophila]MBE3014693.1 hypothetical protein [Microbispora sitophila]